MERIDKGEFLQIGLKGKAYETKHGIFFLNFIYIGGTLLMFALAGLAATGYGLMAGSQLLGIIIPLLIGVFILCVVLFMSGDEIDAVYENGLTHRDVSLNKKLQGKHWIPWGEIERIEYGYIDDAFKGKLDISEYIRIYAGDKATWYFTRNSFGRHNPKFYPLLLKMLHERSPQAEWVRKNVTNYQEYESRDLPIPSPSCPTCHYPLAYIPDYERWYCYECQEYDVNDE